MTDEPTTTELAAWLREYWVSEMRDVRDLHAAARFEAIASHLEALAGAEGDAREIASVIPADMGFVATDDGVLNTRQYVEREIAAALAAERLAAIALAAGVVGEMAGDPTCWDDPVGAGGEPYVLREAERKIKALLETIE